MERTAPLSTASRLAGIKRLIAAIRAVPWGDEDVRAAAQLLVYRLEVLRQKMPGGVPVRPVAAPSWTLPAAHSRLPEVKPTEDR
jgi:hypothetical protein